MMWRLAWRNLWRNRKRTAVTLLATGVSTAVLIVSFALMEGLIHGLTRRAVNLLVGDAQVHSPGFREERLLHQTLQNPAAILGAARAAGLGAAARSFGFGLLANQAESAGAMFWGVVPEDERRSFDLVSGLATGAFLDGSPRGGVVLGKRLARALSASLGTDIVAMVQGADGSLGNELLRVVGILRSIADDLDRSLAIVHLADFERLFSASGAVHEIAVTSRGQRDADEVVRLLSASAAGEEVLSWRALLPQLARLLDYYGIVIWVFGLIFLTAAGLGVMNTMLMATYERFREFGLIKALGATPARIVRDVAAEAFLLSLIGSLLGGALGIALSAYLSTQGIDLTSLTTGDLSIVGMTFDPVWKATLDVKVILVPVLVIWLSGVASALYPAIRAARLDPVTAIHKP